MESKFLRHLLDYAICKSERMINQDARRPTGRLPRIPVANAKTVEAAIADRDIKIILGIRDARGSHGADQASLEAVIRECYLKNEAVSTRQIRKEAKRRGLRADRGRIGKLRDELNLGINKVEVRAQQVASSHFIDLAFVHLQEQLTVLGFAAKGCDAWVERISKLEKDEAPAPLIAPTSADRARLTAFTAQLIEIKAALEGGDSPNWEVLLNDLDSADDKIVFFHVFPGADFPTEVSERLREFGPMLAFDRDWLLKELMRPEMFYLGAGYLPTMADTLERLTLAAGGTSGRICIHQSAAARTDALWLRLRLQQELAEHGIRVRLGTRQAFRLGRHVRIKAEGSSDEELGTALLVPSPITLRLFDLDEPSDLDKIHLDFTGADQVLARSAIDDLVRSFRKALNLQSAFASSRKSELMLKCAEFFCAADTPVFGITSVMGRRPDFRKMTSAHRAVWAAYVLTLFDPDALQPDSTSVGTKGMSFHRAHEDFLTSGALWIESWRERIFRVYEKDGHVPYVTEEAIEATVAAMEQRLSRVWKFGMDEAAQRFANATERATKEKFHVTDWRNDPQKAISLLEVYFDGVWPKVWLTRTKITLQAHWLFRSTHADLRKRRDKSTQIVFDDESKHDEEGEPGGVPKTVVVADSGNSPADVQSETPEMLIRERLKTPISAGDERRLATWYGRLLAAVRRAVEDDAGAPLLPPDVLPPREAVVLCEAVKKSLQGGNLAGVAKNLREAIEKFFRDQ